MSNNFTTPLDVRRLDGGNRWEVLDAFRYHLGSPTGPEFVEVRIGRVTDFASIPIPFRWIWRSPGGPYDKPAVIHDELYENPYVQHVNGSRRRIERGEADAIFREAMEVPELKIRAVTQQSLYRGVRLGGWRAWGRYRAAEAGLLENDA